VAFERSKTPPLGSFLWVYCTLCNFHALTFFGSSTTKPLKNLLGDYPFSARLPHIQVKAEISQIKTKELL